MKNTLSDASLTPKHGFHHCVVPPCLLGQVEIGTHRSCTAAVRFSAHLKNLHFCRLALYNSNYFVQESAHGYTSKVTWRDVACDMHLPMNMAWH